MVEKVNMTEAEFRKKLTPEQYRVLREKGTEPAFSGKYWKTSAEGGSASGGKDKGTYMCAACGAPLFSSGTKFDSGTGWPSFDQALQGAVAYHDDSSFGMRRTEVTCARCGSHLGHVFPDGPTDPSTGSGQATGKRYCINSVCLDLQTDQQPTTHNQQQEKS